MNIWSKCHHMISWIYLVCRISTLQGGGCFRKNPIQSFDRCVMERAARIFAKLKITCVKCYYLIFFQLNRLKGR